MSFHVGGFASLKNSINSQTFKVWLWNSPLFYFLVSLTPNSLLTFYFPDTLKASRVQVCFCDISHLYIFHNSQLTWRKGFSISCATWIQFSHCHQTLTRCKFFLTCRGSREAHVHLNWKKKKKATLIRHTYSIQNKSSQKKKVGHVFHEERAYGEKPFKVINKKNNMAVSHMSKRLLVTSWKRFVSYQELVG